MPTRIQSHTATLQILLVSGFICAVLALQLVSQTLKLTRFWPFVPYEMYSWAHPAGSTFSRMELRVSSGTNGETGRSLTHEDLHVPSFVFKGFLGDAASRPERAHDAAQLLSSLIAAQLGQSYGTAQIWTQTFEIGPEGLRRRDAPWQLVREWSLASATPSRARSASERDAR